jgi:hypothetical protein
MDVSKLLIFQAKKMKQAQILVKIRFKGDLILIPFQYFSEEFERNKKNVVRLTS